MKILKSDPEAMHPSETKDTKVHTPQLTDIMLGKASEKEEEKNHLHDSDDSESFEVNSDDDTIDNIVQNIIHKTLCLQSFRCKIFVYSSCIHVVLIGFYA